MKQKIFFILIILGLFGLTLACMSFKLISDKSLATVEQEQGIYIFIKSKPSAEYQFLGSVKKGIALTGSPEEMFNSMLKKCKKDYPQADGIIFTSAGMDKADCIKFK